MPDLRDHLGGGGGLDFSSAIITTATSNSDFKTMLAVTGSGILHQIVGYDYAPTWKITIDGVVVFNSSLTGTLLFQKKFKSSLTIEIRHAGAGQFSSFITSHSLT